MLSLEDPHGQEKLVVRILYRIVQNIRTSLGWVLHMARTSLLQVFPSDLHVLRRVAHL